ncbi:cupin-like domain-containing protein [Caulobacter mirabilis]|uniref:Peptidylprolyl isomerase n=1 Tax=Caulobacter mirabilis TaxID=69666 RepID=A0A2D2AZ97_9CAUL|nr:cupin-like domain-containing protein [Caulobacter mirabilis]ATQ43301.1 peptidylprolyl isomerase [Caulobacter mirabilis]
MTPIEALEGVTSARFHQEIIPAARPVILRGLVRDWPIVEAGRRSPEALRDYLMGFDAGGPAPILEGPPEIAGRFFYDAAMNGFNFRKGTAGLAQVFETLLAHAGDERPPALALQSLPVRGGLPGLEADNPMPLLNNAIEPRIWLGNRVIVAAHHDPTENIACVAAGRRRFTLFPPEQVANLYMGPFEMTPAGVAISMVDFDAPDRAAHPRFAEAEAAALVADLEPGDAIYIPYLWWHHVRSLDPVNLLVNYWWTPPAPGRGGPQEALFHAMVAIKALPEPHRRAWKAMFDHYVFELDGPAAEHLPPKRRGVLGELTPQMLRDVRTAIARSLAR